MKKALNFLHRDLIFETRISVLAKVISTFIVSGGRGLDVGCGDGTLALLIQESCPDVSFEGVDVLERPNVSIPFTSYDGSRLPFDDNKFDWIIIVDVLHHTDDPLNVLSECLRVCKRMVIIKDHVYRNIFQRALLIFMDWVGNRGHEVRLPYNYLKREEWRSIFSELNATENAWKEDLKLYPQPLDLVFGRGLHFVTVLKK